MIDRPMRFEIEQPVEYWLTDVRNAPRLKGRTLNISSGGVLFQTSQNIGVGRKIEMIIPMARLSPESMEADLRLFARTVRGGQGWVAAQVKKYQILPRPNPVNSEPVEV